MATKIKKRGSRGPKAERVKIEGEWASAVKKALEKKRPKEGWPAVGSKKKGKAAGT